MYEGKTALLDCVNTKNSCVQLADSGQLENEEDFLRDGWTLWWPEFLLLVTLGANMGGILCRNISPGALAFCQLLHHGCNLVDVHPDGHRLRSPLVGSGTV
jgi:hypothetical protein